jgi:Spy/CpxP family protein refolding chaperone
MGRTIGILLALSLAANVFLGGFVMGRVAGPGLPGFGHERGEGGHGARHGGRDDFRELSPAAREKVRASFRKGRKEMAAAVRDSDALREEFIRVLTAETFDRAAAEAVAARIEAFEKERRPSMSRVIIDVMDGLSAQDRRIVARLVERRMAEEMAAGGKRRGGHRGGPLPSPDDDPGSD